MKKPVLKNYIVVGCVKTIGELWKALHSDKSIYVRTWGCIHPCKFFLNNDRCFTIKMLEKMIRESAFYRVMRIPSFFEKSPYYIKLLDKRSNTMTIFKPPSIGFSCYITSYTIGDLGLKLSI